MPRDDTVALLTPQQETELIRLLHDAGSADPGWTEDIPWSIDELWKTARKRRRQAMVRRSSVAAVGLAVVTVVSGAAISQDHPHQAVSTSQPAATLPIGGSGPVQTMPATGPDVRALEALVQRVYPAATDFITNELPVGPFQERPALVSTGGARVLADDGLHSVGLEVFEWHLTAAPSADDRAFLRQGIPGSQILAGSSPWGRYWLYAGQGGRTYGAMAVRPDHTVFRLNIFTPPGATAPSPSAMVRILVGLLEGNR